MVTYYEKKGRRYVPILEKDVWSQGDTWNEGYHLVICKPGLRSTRYNIIPDDAAFIAAQSITAEKLASFILKASKANISPAPFTEEQKKAWESLSRAFDGGPYFVQYDSAIEIARNFLKMLQDEHERKDID